MRMTRNHTFCVDHGEVAEWSNASDSKSDLRAIVTGVRIPPSPPYFIVRLFISFFLTLEEIYEFESEIGQNYPTRY
jgi:hypothetical protein